MPPQPRLAIVATVQQAISTLLTTYEPEFLRFGFSLFVAFATILIVWEGIRMMLSGDSLGEHMFRFAKLLLFVAELILGPFGLPGWAPLVLVVIALVVVARRQQNSR